MLAGQRPGDRRLRLRRRPETVQIELPKLVPKRRSRHPAVTFVYGFTGLILAGALLLLLPVSSVDGLWTSPLDALFTATSAVCVTGLVVVDTGTYWSGFGQVVIMLLIQLGGFGFMTSSTLLLLLMRREATLRERILLRESLGSGGLGSVLVLAKRVILFTIAAELIGAIILTVAFISVVDPATAIWWGLFHSVSAFNNAGFDLIGGYRSLVPFQHHVGVLMTIGALIILGGISYTVVEDVAKFRKRHVRLTVDSKLVLVTTLGLILLGALGLLVTEWTNQGTFAPLSIGSKLLNAIFMSISPRTAGFNSIDMAAISENGLVIIMALMFVGGASGSTAGGIKVQTFSLLLFAIVSTVRGAVEVEAYDRRVPLPYIFRALTVALLALALIFLASFALNAIEPFGYMRILFETFSAFGTVGLTTGITPETGPAGRAILILGMFAGRLGPLTLVLALAAREHTRAYRRPEEGVRIG